MDTLVNSIIVKIQKELNAEASATDAEIICKVTRAISQLSYAEKKAILMTMNTQQICSKYGK